MSRGYCAKLWPPYFKYSVFLFVGFEFVYSACLLAISEAYYKSAAKILPIAYRVFEDTVQKKKVGFDWLVEEKERLEVYKSQMLTLWVISTIGVLLCMVVIIPQFFDFNDRRGNPSHLCLVRRTLAWILFYIMAAYVLILGIAMFWAWSDGGAASRHFNEHFKKAEIEEIFITEIENTFECQSDDDKEVPTNLRCWVKVQNAFISGTWLHILMLIYVAGHVLAFLAIPFFNKQLIKDDDEELMSPASTKLMDA